MTSLVHADEAGFFGAHGGRFLPPHLEAPIAEVAAAYAEARNDPEFAAQYEALLTDYVGRPSPLFLAERLTAHFGGARIYLKREDLNHTGAHKINHCLGEALLAKRMGKKKLLAETGAGQHGVALATAAALLGLECEIHMGAIDVEKQHPNVVRMELLGATIVSVTDGGQCLKDAVDSAFGKFASDWEDTFFAIGSVVGPDPYPTIVRDFQAIVGREARKQILAKEGRLPDALIACVGGGSNALGLFTAFLEDESVKMFGVEPSGRNLDVVGQHAATMTLGSPGMLHGMKTMLLQDADGAPNPVHSIASGLDYPGVGPQHAHLKDVGRVEYVAASDDETLEAFQLLCRTEGIIPALESAHALVHAAKLAPGMGEDGVIVVNLSGRGDKDIDYVADKIRGMQA
ncbi:tryptophan synthase subunit beta [Tessaracoccus antarcticus]|uniref:Tryptophan synthase beta chain n=1 Tax=Tessaracoccus antarcticus TaxID=2479848 RepID=A0A3M0GB37_9ACTN|nr:tryptophan synthase subunit beta [Tessaracoccus antarcticus]RMB62144.1 tryptophan synthase subunit beta [Tessaracoccus antarcticus]